MSLIVFQETKKMHKPKVNDLQVGTWFVNEKNQTFVIVLDDRTHEKRIVCMSHFYKPFIANVPLHRYSLQRVLDVGTLLQISPTVKKGGDNEK